MRSPLSSSRLAVVVGVGVIACAVILFARAHWNSLYDDAFIYLRYARNVENGCGLRFNCQGPAVEGFTGPLYLAALSLGGLVTDRMIDLCQIIGTLALVAAGGLAVATAAALGAAAPVTDDARATTSGRALPWVLALTTALVLALDPFVLLNANIGMETAMAAAACSLVAYAAVTRRRGLLVGATLAATLVRPECLLFVVALPLFPELRRARYLVPIVLGLVAIEVTRYALFGALAPNTYYAKAGGSWRHVELGVAYALEAIRDFPLTVLAFTALLLPRDRGTTYVVVVALGWMAYFLRSGGDMFDYSRMWFPLVPALSAIALHRAAALAQRFGSARLALGVPVALAVVVGGRGMVAHAIPPQHANPRIVEWAAIGTYLRSHYPRGTLVATVPIGAIGYYSSLPILDLVGLTEPAIARAGRTVPTELLSKRWIGHERHNTEHVLERAPTVIVTTIVRDTAWGPLGEARAGFWADWLLLQEIKAGRAPYHVLDAEVLPGRHVLMFERTAAP